MTHYEQRKAWRIKLNAKRNADKDHSIPRYQHDAVILNRAMAVFHISGKTANWGK